LIGSQRMLPTLIPSRRSRKPSSTSKAATSAKSSTPLAPATSRG
jgi:hypothetical protein